MSMKLIADKLGVSKVTVSKALNDQNGVSPELRDKIKEIAKQMDYRINSAARSLKSNKSYNVGLLISKRYLQYENSYYFSISSMLTERFQQLGFSSIIEVITNEQEQDLELPLMYRDRKVDGIVVIGQLSSRYLKILIEKKINLLFFDFYSEKVDVDCVISDNIDSGLEVTKELVENGHTDICYVGNVYSTTSIQDRYLGYLKCLLIYKLPVNIQSIVDDRTISGEFIQFKLPEKLPTAFVCNNDKTAYDLIKQLEKMNLNVPKDISVVGFDNTLYSTLSTPALTTVDQNKEVLVEKTCTIMAKKLDNPEKRYNKVFVKSTLIKRDSILNIK